MDIIRKEVITTVSIVIPTYDRVDDLRELLQNIFEQYFPPLEVIIIDDQSPNQETYDLVEELRTSYNSKSICLSYVRTSGYRGQAKGRNTGAALAKGDVVFFLDDDILLDQRFIYELIKVYNINKQIIGVQGYREDKITFRWAFIRGQIWNRIFLLSHVAKNKCFVLRSFNNVFPYPLTKSIRCEWLTGGCCSYVKEIFEMGMRFDEQLIKYSLNEDTDFSYRVYRKFSGSLIISPEIRYIHKVAQSSHLPDQKMFYLRPLYLRYLFYKNMDQTLLNIIAFNWSRVGVILLAIGSLFRWDLPFKQLVRRCIYVIKAELFALYISKDLKRGILNKYYNAID